MNKKQRILTGVGLAAGLVAGGGAGLILEASGSAGAAPAVATDPPTTTASTGTTGTGTADTSGTTPAAPAAPTKVDRTTKLKELLQSLVDDGTLTQAQLDAVIAKLDTAGPLAGGPGKGARADRGFGAGILQTELNTVATTLGVTADDVRTALKDGQTLAAYAVSKGKTAQDVIDALVADAKTALDAKVADGSMTQAKADTTLTEMTTRITDVVNNGFTKGFPGIGGPGGMGGPGGRHGRGDHGAPDGSTATTAPDTTATTTPVTTG